MDASFLDMLQHTGDIDRIVIGDGIDIDFDRIAQIAIDQHRAVAGHNHCLADVGIELALRFDDFHRPAAEHIARAHQHRVANAGGDGDGFIAAARDTVFGLLEAQLLDQRGKAFAIFGEVDIVGRCAQNWDASGFEGARQFQRRLAAELHDNPGQRARLHLLVKDLEHVFGGQRLEIQAVGRVVIGRHGFRVAVDHDGFIAGVMQREAGMAAAIIELDPLPDAVRPTAEDDNLGGVARLRFAIGGAKTRRFIGRIHIRRLGSEFAGAGINALEHRADPQGTAFGGDLRFQLAGQIGDAGIGKTHGLQTAKAVGAGRIVASLQARFDLHQFLDLAQKPRLELGDGVDAFDAHAFAQGLCRDAQPVRRRARQFGLDFVMRGAHEKFDFVKA